MREAAGALRGSVSVHEYSIVQALLEQVERHAAAHRASHVHRVHLRVGALSGVEIPLLASAYAGLSRAQRLCGGGAGDPSRGGALGLSPLRARASRRASDCAAPTATCRRPCARETRSCSSASRWRWSDVRHLRLRRPRASCPSRCRRACSPTTTGAPRHNREHFRAHGLVALNLMGSPGCGKTALLETTARRLLGRRRTARRAERRPRHRRATPRACAPPASRARAITTGSACHLDARMVHDALHDLPTGTTSTCSSSRTWATWSVPPSTTSARRANVVRALGDRGRGQAAQVPGDVPARRPRAC